MEHQKMPALFVGHGSPMNAIEDNVYTKGWENIAHEFPKPEAILAVSAHWYTRGTRVTDDPHPKMIYDMYGFPDALYRVRYDAPGAPELAREAKALIARDVHTDNGWGLDHGAWSVLKRMYPEADIPVFQLSVDALAAPEIHFRIGREIGALRKKGVLIFGSGNVVHNLARTDWGMQGGYPWALDFDAYIKNKIVQREFQDVIEYRRAGESASLAFATPDHFYPLLYVLGAAEDGDRLSVFNDSCVMGSLSMTSYLFQ